MIEDFDGSILFIGAGKMGGAIIAGLLEEGLDPARITVQDPSVSPEMSELLSKYEIEAISQASEGLNPDFMFLCVKPQIMDKVLPSVSSVINKNTTVVSVAAGTTLANIESHLGSDVSVVRAMPNTPAEIARAMTVLCPNKNVGDELRETISGLLSAIGETAWIDDETQMDAVTALSGSGPAYVFLLTEVMIQAGVKVGLNEDLAKRLATATVSGAAELMRISEMEPSQLRENVTSPNGTTAAALEILMADNGMGSTMEKAVSAAKKRSQELSS